jgi:hypothetical protein
MYCTASGVATRGGFRAQLSQLGLVFWTDSGHLQTIVQSKDIENSPRPSFALEPPKRWVIKVLWRMVRQNTDTPAKRGTVKVRSVSGKDQLQLTDVLRKGLPEK